MNVISIDLKTRSACVSEYIYYPVGLDASPLRCITLVKKNYFYDLNKRTCASRSGWESSLGPSEWLPCLLTTTPCLIHNTSHSFKIFLMYDTIYYF